MAGLKFTNDAAKRLEALYATADVMAQRSETLRKLHLAEGNSVIDLGSAPAFSVKAWPTSSDLQAAFSISISLPILSSFPRGAIRRGWLSYRVGDATGIDEPDESFDVATCAQVAEYIPEVDKLNQKHFAF